MEKIGLIAGNRKFPLKFCEEAREKGCYIVAVAIKKDTSRRINKLADKVYWLGLKDFSRLFDIFRDEGITNVVMAGQISPWRLFTDEVNKDEKLKALLQRVRDHKADTIFSAVAQMLEMSGFHMISSLTYLDKLMPQKGVLTRHEPNFAGWDDIYFGFDLAKEIAYLDIGQTVAVKNKAVVAVEALEGTDKLIRRAGRITKGDFTLVKVSKPEQDFRFDVPVVGLNTVKNLINSKAKCLAIEAGKTLFIDQEESIRLADKKGLGIVSL